MYWSDWNRSGPKIEVANMDGTNRNVFVSNDLGLPNNLAIDFEHNELCWADAGLHRIECIGLHTSNRRIVHTPTGQHSN
jgi:nidogen (entactin)